MGNASGHVPSTKGPGSLTHWHQTSSSPVLQWIGTEVRRELTPAQHCNRYEVTFKNKHQSH